MMVIGNLYMMIMVYKKVTLTNNREDYSSSWPSSVAAEGWSFLVYRRGNSVKLAFKNSQKILFFSQKLLHFRRKYSKI